MLYRSSLMVLLLAVLAPSGYAQDDTEVEDQVAKLAARIELLEAQLKAVTLERDALKKQLESDSDRDAASEKKDPAPLGSIWTGKLTNQKGEGAGIEFSVISRDGKKITFLSKEERGAMWEYDCELTTASKFKIVAVRRLKANEGIVNPPPVGAIIGNGTLGKRKLTVEILWRDAQLKMAFSGDLQEAPKE